MSFDTMLERPTTPPCYFYPVPTKRDLGGSLLQSKASGIAVLLGGFGPFRLKWVSGLMTT